MNEGVRKKLRSQKPVYFDATENSNVVIPKRRLNEIIRMAKANSSDNVLISGGLGLCITSIFSLVTNNGFNAVLGISAGAWEAMFVILSIIGGVMLGVGIYKVLSNRKNLEEEINEIFNKDNKIT